MPMKKNKIINIIIYIIIFSIGCCCGKLIDWGYFVLKPEISIVQIPHGVSYHGNTIHLVIGISSREEDPLQELMQITDILLKPEKCHQFLNASSKQKFIDMINQNYVEEGEL